MQAWNEWTGASTFGTVGPHRSHLGLGTLEETAVEDGVPDDMSASVNSRQRHRSQELDERRLRLSPSSVGVGDTTVRARVS